MKTEIIHTKKKIILHFQTREYRKHGSFVLPLKYISFRKCSLFGHIDLFKCGDRFTPADSRAAPVKKPTNSSWNRRTKGAFQMARKGDWWILFLLPAPMRACSCQDILDCEQVHEERYWRTGVKFYEWDVYEPETVWLDFGGDERPAPRGN